MLEKPIRRPMNALLRTALLASALLAASCGRGDAPVIAGSWREPTTIPGSFFEMTLLADGSAVSGTGVAHVEAGANQPFTVAGTASQLTFTFASGKPSQTYEVTQVDVDDLRLSGAPGTLLFVRVQ
jgi:hypothetical protein